MAVKRREIKEKFNVFLPPAVGYRLSILIKLLFQHKVVLKYYPRALVILLINIINSPFRLHERLTTGKLLREYKSDNDPIFILGHWRSGTTLLHSLLTQDPQMAYMSTYQSVFPDTIFRNPGKFIFKNFMDILIPATRKGDNVKLNPDYPQEEEFTLGSNVLLSFYYYWFFPDYTMDYFNKTITLENTDQQLVLKWFNSYKTHIKKACLNTGKPTFLSKNPPNTGRIVYLIKHFPGCKFIHIHRNPVLVYLSTKKFLSYMMPHLEFHSIENKKLEDNIIEVYKLLYKRFFEERVHIPDNRFVEIRFEDLEAEPVKQLQQLYKKLNINGFDEALPAINTYLGASKGYKKNVHKISRNMLDRILSEWDFTMKEWNYNIPSNLEIIE